MSLARLIMLFRPMNGVSQMAITGMPPTLSKRACIRSKTYTSGRKYTEAVVSCNSSIRWRMRGWAEIGWLMIAVERHRDETVF